MTDRYLARLDCLRIKQLAILVVGLVLVFGRDAATAQTFGGGCRGSVSTYAYDGDPRMGHEPPGVKLDLLECEHRAANGVLESSGLFKSGRSEYDAPGRVTTSLDVVATETGGATAKPGRYTEGDLNSTVDGMTEAEKQAVRNRQAGDKFDDKAWKSAKKKLDKTEKFNDERNAGKDRGQPNK